MVTLVEHPWKRVGFNPRLKVKEYVVRPDGYTIMMVLDHKGSRLTLSHDKSAVYLSYKLSKQRDIHNNTNVLFSESPAIDMTLCTGPLNKPNRKNVYIVS